VSARWRVVRLPGGVDACTHKHRFEWAAYRCKRRQERAEPLGVWFDVRPAVKP